MAGLIRLALVILLALVVISNGWSGNYGSRIYCLTRRERVCAYLTWSACCYWKWISRAYEETRYFCLPGWRHNGNTNCNIAICNPSCKNSGTCSQPNQCDCTGAFNGPTCEGKLCSHLKPCYPGECSKNSSGGSQCNCETNFQFENNGCLNMRPELKPEIYQCQIVLRYYTSKKGVFMNKYSILLDTTVNGDEILNDELWSNREIYNKIDFMGISNFDPNVNSPVPSSYISEAKFGLVDVKFETVLEKENGDLLVNAKGELSCANPPSKNSPILGVHNCTVLDTDYVYRIDNGANLTITLTIQSGGYRKLKNIDTGVDYQTQYYTGQTMVKRVMFRFDSEKPYHCFPNCIDDSKILEFGDEYTKNPLLQLRWDGWEDSLSGVYRYAWEIFRLTPNGDGELREKDPLGPIKIAEVNNTDSFKYPNYTLPEPGLYSIILQVADKANNSDYVRRFVLYDPKPRIQISDDPEKRLHSSSSTKESNYTWQADTTGVIKFDWTGFFYNQFLEENQLLNQILDYPLQFFEEGASEHKYVAKTYKNEDGRNQAEVPNARGMTSFQYGHHKDNNGGNSQPAQPTTWFNLSNPIQTKFDLKLQVDSGETVVFWVKATDPFGNERIEKTQTSFDSSKPIVNSVLFDYESETVSGRSRLTCVAKDMESGIALVSWKAVREDTNIEYANGTLPWPQSNYQADADIRELICLAKIDRCFDIEAELEIDNCDLRLPSSEDSTGVTLNVDVLNLAMISGPRQSFKIGDIKKLSGYEQCYPEYYESSGLSAGSIVGIIIGVLLLVVIAVLVFLFVTNRPPFTKSRKERGSVYIQNALGKPTHTNMPQTSTGAYPNNAYKYEEDDVYLYGGKDFEKGQSWQIPHYQLTLLGDITIGKFARISKAKLKSSQDDVVAKMLKDNFTPDDEMLMRAKINYMATVVGSHPNVLTFVGAVIDNNALGPVMILEHCELGQLDKWLISQIGDMSSDTTELLMRTAFGVCKGMAYLAAQKIVHKKLAARNVLLTFTREPKITGFGPSKASEDEDAKERIPIKWTAPECTTSLKNANQRSDVWSFGVVLWEIFSLGEVPYGNIKSRDVENRIKGGYRMEKPEMCNNFYNSIMTNCWQENPRKRESFKKIQEKIAGTFDDKSGDDFYY